MVIMQVSSDITWAYGVCLPFKYCIRLSENCQSEFWCPQPLHKLQHQPTHRDALAPFVDLACCPPLSCNSVSLSLISLTHYTNLVSSYASSTFVDLIRETRRQNIRTRVLWAVLSDSATPSNLNASNFLTEKDNMMLNPIFGMLSSRAIQNISNMLGYL